MDVEPEKEIVMIVSKEDITQGIVRSIREKLEIDKPGHGIILFKTLMMLMVYMSNKNLYSSTRYLL